jgi:hypothetical protein
MMMTILLKMMQMMVCLFLSEDIPVAEEGVLADEDRLINSMMCFLAKCQRKNRSKECSNENHFYG